MITGKRVLCYTEVADFTSMQGIGNDPIYKRFGSVNAVVSRVIPAQYRSFLAEPEYVSSEDQIYWYTDQWGENEFPVRLADLSGQEREIAYQRLREVVSVYRNAERVATMENARVLAAALKFINEDFVYMIGDRPVLAIWGMTPDTVRHISAGTIVHNVDYENSFTLTFDAGENGELVNPLEKIVRRKEGVSLSSRDIPMILPKEGFTFAGWDPDPIGMDVRSPLTFRARYTAIAPPPPPVPPAPIIPEPEPEPEPEPLPPPPPPVRRMTFKEWLMHHGGLKGFLLFLLLLALLLFLLWALSHPLCLEGRFHRHRPGLAEGGFIDNVPSTPIDPGDLGSGVYPGVGDIDYHIGVFPITPGNPPGPSPEDPDLPPDVIPNVLNLFFEKDDADLRAFAGDFRHFYPDTAAYKLDYDDYVKRVSVLFPAPDRSNVRRILADSLGRRWEFILVDEVAIAQDLITPSADGNGYPGWHRDAIHLNDAWQITKGSPDVTVAIVDDGVDVNHPLFAGRVVGAYNIFTRTSSLSFGSGHGTHVAGLAVGGCREDGKVSGVAPECRLMPIQVFNGNYTTLSAAISGIAYAIHKGADVVNASLGASYRRYAIYSRDQQASVAQVRGKQEEAVWNKILKMADSKGVILVFAAGNDNVLAAINPQNRPEQIVSVSAVTPNLHRASFSDFGTGTTVAAPGVSIVSTMPGGIFGEMQGTSQAAPIVAGTVALMKSRNKSLKAQEVISILTSTGSTVQNDGSGPMVLADKAVAMVIPNAN